MRDRGGYGRVVPDICGDVGIVGCADALEFAERVGGIESGVGKRLGKQITQAEYAEARREKSGSKKKREKREKNRAPNRVGINSDRSLQTLYGFDCWDWGILMMTSLGLARPSSSRAMDSILWGSVLRDLTSSESSAFSLARRLMSDCTRSISNLVRRMAR